MDAAEFLQYRASEREIVDRILMNLHPDILVQAAFLPRPGLYRELRDMVGLIEERMTVLAERQRSDTCSSSSQVVEKGNLSDNKPGGAMLGASSPVRMDLRVGVVGNKDMYRGIVRDIIHQVL